MNSSDNDEKMYSEEAMRSEERSLGEQINLCIGLIDTAFRHVQHWPNATSLASADRAIDLLRSFLSSSERLKERGHATVHTRLMDVLKDVTSARAKWAQTIGVLVSADISDATKLAAHELSEIKRNKELNDERFKQGNLHASETRKLL